MLLKSRVNRPVPRDRILRGSPVDHPILPAVQAGVMSLRRLNSGGEQGLKGFLRRAGFREAGPGGLIQLPDPGRALVRKGQRRVAVEIVDHPVVRRRLQVLHGFRAVVPVAAHQNQRPRGDPPDPPDAFPRDAVPRPAESLIRHLVQQLKGHLLRVIKPGGQPFPQLKEPFLAAFAVEEALLLFPFVKGKTVGLVQVQHHLQLPRSGPGKRLFYPGEALRPLLPPLILKNVVIHGNPDMVQPPGGDDVKVLLRDKVVHPLPGIIALGKPPAQVHAPVEAKGLHPHDCFLLF